MKSYFTNKFRSSGKQKSYLRSVASIALLTFLPLLSFGWGGSVTPSSYTFPAGHPMECETIIDSFILAYDSVKIPPYPESGSYISIYYTEFGGDISISFDKVNWGKPEYIEPTVSGPYTQKIYFRHRVPPGTNSISTYSTLYFESDMGPVISFEISRNGVYPIHIHDTPPTCLGGSISLGTGTQNVDHYSWSGPAAFTSTLANPTRSSATSAMAGTYSVTLTYNELLLETEEVQSAGCMVSGTGSVTVNSGPGSITGGMSICAGGTSTLSNSVNGGTWTSGNAGVATVNASSGIVTGVSAGTARISYAVCSGVTSVVVTINPLPSSITGTSVFCMGATTTLSSTTGGGTWSNTSSSAIATVGSSSGIVTGVNAGVATITYTSGGCKVSKMVTVQAALSAGTFSIHNTGTFSTLNNNGTITTIAGNGTPGFSGDGGPASSAQLDYPSSIFVDPAGNIYITESNRIRKINTDGIISTIAGTGAFASNGDGGPATAASLIWPNQLTMDAAGNLYVAEAFAMDAGITYGNVRKINTSGIITTIAITSSPQGITIDPSGNLYVCDAPYFGKILKIDPSGTITTIAGTGSHGDGGNGIPATAVGLNTPTHVLRDAAGNIYFSDMYSYRVYKIDPAGILHYFTGNGINAATEDGIAATSASLMTPQGIAMDAAGNFYTADWSQSKVFKVDPSGIITTFTGTSSGYSGDGGPASAAQFSQPTDVAIDHDGNMLVADAASGTIRKIRSGTQVSGAVDVCAGSSALLENSVPGGTWSSSNTSVATIGSDGTVTGIAAGSTVISYTLTNSCNTVVATVTINVPADAGSISGTSTMCPGTTETFTFAAGVGTWSSSNPSVATVGSAGSVHAVSAGSVTISYTYTSTCGTTTATFPLTVETVTTGSITGAGAICPGGTLTLSDAVIGGTWSSSNTSVATIDADGTVSGLTAGTTTISYAVMGACGTAYATAVVTVNGLPDAGSVTGPTTVCDGASITLACTPGGGTWSSSNTEVATVNASGVVTGEAVGTASITYTLTNGCGSDVATATITVNTAPVAGTITGPSFVCSSSSPITLGDIYGGGTWSTSNTNATVGSTGVVTGVYSGTVIVTYTLANSCGSAFATRLITVNPVPVIIGPSASVCVGATLALTGNIPGGVWGSGNNEFATADSSGLVTGVSASVVNIAYVVCPYYIGIKTITVNALPAVLPTSGPDSLCPGSAITLTNATSGTGTRTWSSSNLSTATVNSAGVVTGISSGTVTISFRYILGCPNYATKVVTVKSLATPAITGTATVCTGGATTSLTATPSGGSWVSGTPSIATIDASSGLVTSVAVGTTKITYSYDNGNGCTSFAYKIITVNSLPGIGVPGGASTVCVAASATLTNTVAGGVWMSGNPTVATIGASSGIVTGADAGTVYITYTVTGANGCSVFRTKIMTVNALPSVPGISGTSWAICQGSTAAFTESTTGGTYQWIVTPASVATVTATSGVVTGLTEGTAVLSYKYTLGCTNYATATISVIPVTAASITGTAVMCAGSSTTLTGSPAGGTWTSSVPSKATVDVSTGIVTGVAGGTTTITYTYTAGSGCSSRSTVIATVNATPGVGNIGGGTAAICQLATTTLTDATAGGVWSSSNTDVATVGTSGIVTGVAAGNSNITYLVTGTNGCSALKTKQVTVNALPSVPPITGASFTLCPGGSSTFSDATTGGTHVWMIAPATVATVNASSGAVTGVGEGTATLSYKYTLGCINYATAIVTISPAPSVSAISGPSSVAVGGSVILTNTTAGGAWSSSNTTKATVGSGTGAVTGVATGTANITYAIIGCSAARATRTISVLAARPEDNAVPASVQISVFPNPTTGQFTVESPITGTFTVYTMDGKLVQQMSVTSGTNTFNLRQELAAGVYVCRFNGDDGSSTMVRLVYE